jgi:hypothetical protein
VLAANQGLQTRRFQVLQVIPQPFGPPNEEKLADRGVAARAVGTFELLAIENFTGLLRVTGAPQMVISALLEVRENGALIETVNLPVITGREEDEADRARQPLKHDDGPGGTDDHDQTSHLQGIGTTEDGAVAADFAVLNLSEKAAADCVAEFFLPAGSSILRMNSISVPAGGVGFFDDVLLASADPEQSVNSENIRGQIGCHEDTFFAWATVYRNGGRDVAILTPSASTK